MMGVLWSIITGPFRLIGWIVGLVGRLVGATLGFVLMVGGTFLACFPHAWIAGVPVFLFGLILTLRSLR